MSGVRLREIMAFLERLAPLELSEGWDRSGLQVGDPGQKAGKILIALDPTRAVIEEAIRQRQDLIVTHHPLYLSPPKNLDLSVHVNSLIALLIRNGIALYSAHTNFDRAKNGVNDILAATLGLQNVRPFGKGEELFKVVVTVPAGLAEAMLDAISGAGGATIGNYEGCAFFSGGVGLFTPGPGTNPHIGEKGTRERVEETRIEATVANSALAPVLKAIRASHPYEEPVIDIYRIDAASSAGAPGRIGELSAPVEIGEFTRAAADLLGAPSARFSGKAGTLVKTVAVCGGSGASLWRTARISGADALVTGDVKYHEALDAASEGFCMVDAGHGPTEKAAVKGLAGMLEDFTASSGEKVEVSVYLEADPFTWL